MQSLLKSLDNFQQRHKFSAFVYGVIKKYGEDNTGYHAALLTYYGFLALFPLLMVATTVINHIVGSDSELGQTLTDAMANYFPLLGDQLASNVSGLKGSGFALLSGLLLSLYGARGVADVFRKGIQDIWDVPQNQREGFPKAQLKSLATVVVGGAGFILAAVIASWASTIGSGWAFRGLSLLINLFILFWLFNFLINLSLPKQIGFKDIRLGAAVAAVGLVILQFVGTYFLARQLKTLDALYSYFAVALGLMFWIYLQAQVLFYSVEVAVVSSKRLWPRSLTEKPKKS